MSTKEQGISGLGLAAQRKSIVDYISASKGELVDEIYSEIESGKNNERPILMAAIKRCDELGATLLIARLDRLSRNLHFITALMESCVAFTAVDMPQANSLTIHILAAVAQNQRESGSERTRLALQVRKAKGLKL